MFDGTDEGADAGPWGAELAGLLEGLELENLDEGDLVDAVAAWFRVAAWAEARADAAISALVERLTSLRSPAQELAAPSRKAAAAELALRLGITRQAALARVRTARVLDGPLWATGEALERGRIDHRKADLIASALDSAPLEVAIAVEEAVLPRAGRRTSPQLQQDLQRALLEADPEWATDHHKHVRSTRRVNHCRPLPFGMVSIYAVLPAAEGTALDLSLDAAARTAKAAGDDRTVDQLRADVLGHVAVEALRTGHFGGAAPCSCQAAVPGSAAGAGQPAAQAAAQAQPRTTAADQPAAPPAGSSTAPQQGTPVRLGTLGGQPVRVDVTVPLSTLLGGDEPGELKGYGPIDPATARALALGGVWRRLVTDPLSGAVVDVGRARYRPPQELATLVRERDRTCVGGGCRTSASGCDLDHTVPFAAGGPTALHNLGCMCPSWCHLLKTTGDFTVEQLPGGVFEWRSVRTGHGYRREADGTTSYLGRKAPPRSSPGVADSLRHECAPDAEQDTEDPPPF